MHFILQRINEFVFTHLSRCHAARRFQTVVPVNVLNDSNLATEDNCLCWVWKTVNGRETTVRTPGLRIGNSNRDDPSTKE